MSFKHKKKFSWESFFSKFQRSQLRLINRCYDQSFNNTSADDTKILIAKSILSQQINFKSDNINNYEFKVFSQFGDDGIIQFLIRRLNINQSSFIEFGVSDYKESNTRFLLMNNNWSGFVIDGSVDNIKMLKSQYYFWKYDLQALSAFITCKNINKLISKSNFNDIGLLHIDLDGNDYWIFKSLDLSNINPKIIIIEYNSVFGNHRFITTPYKSDFDRTQAHYSNLYCGASLGAIVHLAKLRGYSFIGCNLNGNNSYFIKNDLLDISGLKDLSIKNGYIESKFRESKNCEGRLNYARNKERLELIRGLPVYNIITNKIEKI